MFAARGVDAGDAGKPRDAANSDDDDWLRVGRSFKAPSTTETASVNERALQLYAKPKKRSRDKTKASYSEGDSDREECRSKKHGKSHKKKKWKKKSEKKPKARRCRYSDSESSTSSRESSDDKYRRSLKHKRRDEGWIEKDSSQSNHVDRYVSRGTAGGLALLKTPVHDQLEVYYDTQRDGHHREKLFEFDCAGDGENLVFGMLYTHEQPLYRLATRRCVVDGAWIVPRLHSQTQDVEKLNHDDTGRYFGRVAKVIEKRSGTKRLHLAYSQRRLSRRERSAIPSKLDEMAFIPLDALVEGELDGVAMENADGNANIFNESPNQLESIRIMWQTDQENIEHFLVTRQKELNERVSTTSNDIEAWLDLIAFQDEMGRLAGNKRLNDDMSNEDGSILEKQKTILAKAMEKNPDSSILRQIQLNLLWHEQANGVRSDTDSYHTLVEKLLESDQVSTELWAKLIQSSQQKFGSFSMTMLRDRYARVISVLNKELIGSLKSVEAKSVARTNSFVRVVGQNSLLGKADPYEADTHNDKAWQLARGLTLFHHSMIRAELAAGFTERAVALAQAQIEFNCIGSTSVLDATHSKLIEAFSARWNEQRSHMGEDNGGETDYTMATLPGVHTMDVYCADYLGHVLRCFQVPEVIKSLEHELDLLGPFGEKEEDVAGQENVTERTASVESNAENRGRWVYSNLHGERIWIADANESQEYERILHELRGSQKSLDRQQVQNRKIQSYDKKKQRLVAKLRDERADYPGINGDEDKYANWVMREIQADLVQWRPLQPSNPEHADLIDMQPDRAILTEEILPFVFRVPRQHHFSAVVGLLNVMGLRLTIPANELEDPTHLLSSDDFNQFSMFTAPMLRVLDLSSDTPIAMSGQDRYNMVMKSTIEHIDVSELATVDPSRVQFVRNVFLTAMKHFNTEVDTRRFLKGIWMEFEADVVLRGGGSEKTLNDYRAFCQGLFSTAEIGTVDTWLMSVYTSVEARLKNKRQVIRIFDKIVASLDPSKAVGKPQLCNGLHRLIFIRVHQELSANNDRFGALKAFYLLWQVWESRSSNSLEHLTKSYRKTPGKLEAWLSSHLEQHENEVIGKYRIELQASVHQCTSKRHKTHDGLPHSCCVPFALANLCSAVYASRGFQAAKQEFEHFLGAKSALCHAKLCWYTFLSFLQAHHVSERHPLLPPREWRLVVARGVEAFTLNPLFLRLFVDAETSNTMSQSLRKHFQNRRQAWQRRFDSPELIEWLFALLCEFARAERCGIKLAGELPESRMDHRTCCVLHRWGKNRPAVERIRCLFEEMVSQRKTSGAAMGWRLYLRFELAVGKVDAARRVFYRGLAKCPWSKALYLDGIRVLRPFLSQSECQEIPEFLAAKELHVRVDD